jgi:putative hemolysin
MRIANINANTHLSQPKLALSFASTPAEVREAQRLRYKVFVEAGGLAALANAEGLDQDAFDAYCEHLIVRDADTLKVVGTYRLLTPQGAYGIGCNYSEREFDLSRLEYLRGRMIEAGRACIHPDYRSGGVIMLLWAGLAACMKKQGCDYLMGCASVSVADGGHNAAALYHGLEQRSLAPLEYRVAPHLPFPLERHGAAGHPPKFPPLLKGYLRSGAWVCGAPAWDPDFHSADFFLLLPLAKLEQRYARHYLKDA